MNGRWREYFGQVMNGEEMKLIGDDVRRRGDMENEIMVRKEMEKEQIMGVLKNMNGGKAFGLHVVVVKRMKNGVVSIKNWLFNGYTYVDGCGA